MSEKEPLEEKEAEEISDKKDWKDALLSMLTVAFKQYTTMISEGIYGKINALISGVKKLAIIVTLLIIGFVFVLVGSAQMISETLERNHSFGYVVIGIPLLLIGIMMNYFRGK